MSNQQNDTFYENYYEFIEESQEIKEKTARRHFSKDKKPFDVIMESNNLVFNSINNLNK